MPTSLTETEVAELVPGPGSMVWKYASDPRTLGAAGYALLLQIAHPTVAPAVKQLSDYKRDPFGRLLRTTDYLLVMTFGGPENAVKTARTLREMHKRIKGVTPDGRRYNAFEPEAWAWVHATLSDAMIAGSQNFARPMSAAERDQFYREWRRLGRVVQVRDQDLPFTWAEYQEYFDRMVAERLEDSDTVQEFLDYIQREARSPLPQIPHRAWRLIGTPVGRAFWIVTAGLLPADLRERFGIRWTRSRERQFRAIARTSRALTPLMPAVDRVFNPEKALRWRREEIEREYLAPALEAG